MICTQQVQDSTHDGCHALQRVAPFYPDFCHGSQQVAIFCHAGHTTSTCMATALLSSFFGTFHKVVHQPDDVHTSTFLQICNHSWTCRTSILEGATFHKMNWCKFLWGNPCRAIETFYHWDFSLGLRVLDASLSSYCIKEFGDGFGCVIFARLLTSWRKLPLSLLEHCPLDSHCQKSPRMLCPRCFGPWFLTTACLS